MTDRESVALEEAFLLHQRAYRNTSQIIECFTRSYGVVALVAQGSRRPRGGQRALLQPFVPLRVSWVRRGELGRLTSVELREFVGELGGQSLLASFYLNELILRLLARGDANADAYSCYSRALAELRRGADTAATLRIFELGLLEALGYGLNLYDTFDTDEPIRAEIRYRFEPEHGARAVDAEASAGDIFWGHELISLRDGTLGEESSLRAAKRLLSRALQLYLGDRPLRTRAVLKDLLDAGIEL
ncbi:MAG TPA: DNA repair protein RecO [Gammaproteobacteria bacterium]